MNIPCIINNRNRLTTTRTLVEQLISLGYFHIFILDMASTYEPLLEWYKDCPAEVIYLGNLGHQALWKSGILDRFQDHEFIVYSDSDIQLNENSYPGFIEELVGVAKDFGIDKVGLSIQIDDLPNNQFCNTIRHIEARYWTRILPHPIHTVYNAICDTTFCVIRTTSRYSWQAVRVGGVLTCRHTPWYIEGERSEEEQYCYTHADSRYSSYKQLLR